MSEGVSTSVAENEANEGTSAGVRLALRDWSLYIRNYIARLAANGTIPVAAMDYYVGNTEDSTLSDDILLVPRTNHNNIHANGIHVISLTPCLIWYCDGTCT